MNYFVHMLMYNYTNLGWAIVLNIWNIDARQRQTCHIREELCYFMSVSNKLFYLLVSIIPLSQDRIIIIFTVFVQVCCNLPQITECTCSISHTAPFKVEAYTVATAIDNIFSDSDSLFTAFRPQARTSVHICIKVSNKNANTIIYNFNIPTT